MNREGKEITGPFSGFCAHHWILVLFKRRLVMSQSSNHQKAAEQPGLISRLDVESMFYRGLNNCPYYDPMFRIEL